MSLGAALSMEPKVDYVCYFMLLNSEIALFAGLCAREPYSLFLTNLVRPTAHAEQPLMTHERAKGRTGRELD